VRDVDAIEQHGQLRGIQLRSERVLSEGGQAEAALLQSLVGEHEASGVPPEDFDSVAPARDEDEEVAGVEILLPLGAHQRRQSVNAVTHVHRLTRQQDSHSPR
jgi:hypothetical protein